VLWFLFFEKDYLMFATSLGNVKKLPLKDVSKPRATGVRIINLPAKKVFVRGKKGVQSSIKKALVYLKKGDKIEFV
jgi:DNA gyrase/topoisomerase IV subunit A